MSGSPSLTIQNSTGLVDTSAAPAWEVLLEMVGCGDDSNTIACLREVDGDVLLEAQNNLSATFSP